MHFLPSLSLALLMTTGSALADDGPGSPPAKKAVPATQQDSADICDNPYVKCLQQSAGQGHAYRTLTWKVGDTQIARVVATGNNRTGNPGFGNFHEYWYLDQVASPTGNLTITSVEGTAWPTSWPSDLAPGNHATGGWTMSTNPSWSSTAPTLPTNALIVGPTSVPVDTSTSKTSTVSVYLALGFSGGELSRIVWAASDTPTSGFWFRESNVDATFAATSASSWPSSGYVYLEQPPSQ